MKISIGEKIRELRQSSGRRQEDLAAAVGVTAQAVSRWEAGGSYPDLELLPCIANFFGVSVDELFGYQNDRDKKIDAIIEKIDSFHIKARSDDGFADECLAILRDGLAEFPRNERLMLTLADTLAEIGWRRRGERSFYDSEGFSHRDSDSHKQNIYWSEAIKLCETLISSAADYGIVTRAISISVLLYRNIGENDKAIALANRMPEMDKSREVLLAASTDGKDGAKRTGELLLKTAHIFTEQMIYALSSNENNFKTDLPVEKVRGVISLWELLCGDDFGAYNGELIKLYLYLSRLEWERGLHDDAFTSLDKALSHARALEKICDGEEHAYSSALLREVSFKTEKCGCIAESLPDDWPFWHKPDHAQVEKEIKSDPRWDKWVTRCRA